MTLLLYRIIRVACCGIGLIFLIGGLYFLSDTLEDLNHSATTTGTVVEVYPANSEDKETIYHPIVEFQTTDGRNARANAFYSTSPPHHVGDRVTVIYDIRYYDYYNFAKIKDTRWLWWNWLFPLALIVSGISLVYISYRALLKIKKLQIRQDRLVDSKSLD